MSALKKILVLSSGGDSPGMNAAIRAVVRTALHHKLEVFGTLLGYQGLIEKKIFPLTAAFVGNSIQRGGTILQSGRCMAFKEERVREECRGFLLQQQIDGLVVLGGDGSFRGASLLAHDNQLRVMGIPCTIDNDIPGTDYAIGFDTARNTALQAIDKIRDTAFSFNRNFLIEVMGRNSGFLAVDVGIAGGAEFILIPEAPMSISELVQRLQNRSRVKRSSIIVVAEANNPGRSFAIAEEIAALSGIEYKVCVLGHTQRGGSPTVQDRKIASMMGYAAVKALLAGENNKMTAEVNGKLTLVNFPSPEHTASHFQQVELLEMNAMICDVS